MRKHLKYLGILLCMVVFLVACDNKNQNTDTTEAANTTEQSQEKTEETEITFMIPDWGAPTDEMLEEFKNETGITVNVLPTSWDDIRDKIATVAVGKQVAADVFEVDWSWTGEFHAADWLMPIDMSDEDKEDMPTIKSFTIGDEVLAVPYANDFRIAFYNKEMFDKVGADAPKTWDELIDACKKLKEQGICEYPIGLPLKADESTSTTLMWLAYSRNNKFFNDDDTINKEAVKDGLTVIEKIVKEGLVDPANAENTGQMAYAKILSEEAAFMIGPSSYVTRVNDPEKSKVVDKIMPILLPGIEKEADVTVPFAEAVGISKYTKNPEAAEKWVKWYTSKENQLKMFNDLSALPTRNSVLNGLIEDGTIKNSGAMVDLAKMIESPFPNGVPKYYTKMSTEIFNTVNQMTSGKLTADEAANKIEENVNKIVEENK